MQHDEAGAIGHEVGLRRRDGVEGKDAVARPGDARLVYKPLIARPRRRRDSRR